MAQAPTKSKAAATAADRASQSRPVTVTDADIARRAYDFYLARDCEHGHDVEDWLRAERDLRKVENTR